MNKSLQMADYSWLCGVHGGVGGCTNFGTGGYGGDGSANVDYLAKYMANAINEIKTGGTLIIKNNIENSIVNGSTNNNGNLICSTDKNYIGETNSLDENCGENQEFSWFDNLFSTTIINNDTKPVFVKPETDNPQYNGASWIIPAGATRTYKIDGLATQFAKNKVFKIHDNPFGYNVVINPGGSITIPWYVSGSWLTKDEIQQSCGAYPANWDNLFKSAETGTFNMTEWWNRPSWWHTKK